MGKLRAHLSFIMEPHLRVAAPPPRPRPHPLVRGEMRGAVPVMPGSLMPGLRTMVVRGAVPDSRAQHPLLCGRLPLGRLLHCVVEWALGDGR